MAQLVEYVKHTEKELQGKEIELLTGGKPPENLTSKVGVERRDEMQMEKTLEELKLSGSAVIVHLVSDGSSDVYI